MGPEAQRNPYRDAYMAANTELDEIMEHCARLRARKERIEAAVRALQPIVELGAIAVPQQIQAAAETTAPALVPAIPPAESWPAFPQSVATPAAAPPAMKEVSGGSIERRLASLLNKTA